MIKDYKPHFIRDSIRRYMGVIDEMSELTPQTRRTYKVIFKKLSEFSVSIKERSLTNAYINEFLSDAQRFRMINNRNYTTLKTKISDYIRWAQANGDIPVSENFDLLDNTSDKFIHIFSKEKWAHLDDLMEEWIKGKNIPDITADELYRRKLTVYYVRFMNEARPYSAELVEDLRWGDVTLDDSNRILEVRAKGAALSLSEEALVVLGRWAISCKHRSQTTRIFCPSNKDQFDFLSAICQMAVDFKIDVLNIIRGADFRRNEFYTYQEGWGIILEVFSKAAQTMRK